jgi:hypothetical protein
MSIATRNSTRIVGLKVDGTGTASLSGVDATTVALTDNGTGDYTLTLDTAFAAPPVVVCMGVTDDITFSHQTSATSSVVRIECRGVEKEATGTFDSAIKFHASLAGADGNDITIAFTDGGTAGSETITSVSDAGAIVLDIEGGVSTATQVHALLSADTALAQEARTFVSSEVLVGATAIAAVAATALTGGVDGGATDCDFDVLMYGLE